MHKSYIIVISVVSLLWCGFMGYRHMTGKQEAHTHREKAYNQITEVAKKSPRAGLAQMGMALNKYYKVNHAYPRRLKELYPKYLANKAFIDEIEWYYEPRGDDFFLSKTVIVSNRRIVASIDKGLRPRTETGVMVAAPGPVPKEKEVKRPKDVVVQRPEPLAQSRLALARADFLKALRQRQMNVTSVSLPERDEARIISTVEPEIVPIIETEVASGMESELSQRYLVWKDKNGILGFSNVQYPDADKLSIYAMGRWFNVKMPLRKDKGPINPESETAEREKDHELIASSLNGRYLMWKDKQGTMGFGNVQYPETKDISHIHVNGSWESIIRLLPKPKFL
ncbi:MAG: hypothetical protein HWN51_06855 [Desulfobacterales bacterium]|nr:hypothetical protein [Desulfobacterales bacterium]